MKIFRTALLALALTGCATTNYYSQTVNSWQGGDANKLTQKWGIPDTAHANLNGNTFLSYTRNASYMDFAPAASNYTTVVTPKGTAIAYAPSESRTNGSAFKLTCKTWFEVDAHKRIVATGHEGTNCYGDSEFLKNMGNS